MNTWTALSNEIAAAVESAAPSIVQVHGRRRVAAGLVVAENTVLTTAAIDDDKAAIRAGNGQTAEGAVLGRIGHMGLTVRARRGPWLAAAGAGRRTEAWPPGRCGRPHLERRRDGRVRANRRGRRTASHRPLAQRSIG